MKGDRITAIKPQKEEKYIVVYTANGKRYQRPSTDIVVFHLREGIVLHSSLRMSIGVEVPKP